MNPNTDRDRRQKVWLISIGACCVLIAGLLKWFSLGPAWVMWTVLAMGLIFIIRSGIQDHHFDHIGGSDGNGDFTDGPWFD